jgi:hypothetical protein
MESDLYGIASRKPMKNNPLTPEEKKVVYISKPTAKT